jgi:hypothetical protein
MPIQGDAVMHAAVAAGGQLKEPASPLIDGQRTGTAFRHESADAAVETVAFFDRLFQTFDVNAFATVF